MSRYDDEDDTFERPSGGYSRGSSNGVGPSSIAYESPRRKQGRRRLITSLVVLLALGGFVGIVWHAYNQGKAGGGDAVVPLLKAEDSPTKVRPDQPGGMDVPNQDKLIYDRLAPGSSMATPQIERLLPPAESPVARPVAPTPPPAAQAPTPVAPPANTAELQPPPLGERQVAPAPTPQPPIPVAPPAPSQAVPSAQVPSAQAARPTPAPQQQAALPPAQPIPAGAARIQLGAVRSADAAQKEWARLQSANKDILGGMSMNVVTADLGERGIYYRIQAGPAADANDVCAKLKARNVGCIVVR